MSRRPADKERRSAKMGHGQQAIWDVIRDKRRFTVTDVWGLVDMHRKSIINYLHRLTKAGYLCRAADFEESFAYELVKDAGLHAPRLTRDGNPVAQGGGTQNMWNTMRSLRQFSPTDIEVNSSTDTVQVSILSAKAYCTELLKAGYLTVVKRAQPPVSQAVYKLIRDTGPLPPRVQRVKQVFDQNLQRVMTKEDEA